MRTVEDHLIGVILNDRFMAEKVSPIAIAQIGQWAERRRGKNCCPTPKRRSMRPGPVLTTCCHSTAYMTLRFIDIENNPCLESQARIYLYQTLCDILVNC